MKRIIAAVVIAVLIAALCVSSSIVMNKNFEQIRDLVKNCEESYKSDGAFAAASNVEALEKKWLKIEKILSTVTNHDRIDAIHITITRMHAFALADNFSGFLSEAAELHILIDQLEADEKITMHSVF